MKIAHYIVGALLWCMAPLCWLVGLAATIRRFTKVKSRVSFNNRKASHE